MKRKLIFPIVVICIAGLAVLGLMNKMSLKGFNKGITIGVAAWVDNPQYQRNIAGFKEELAKNGFQEGKNIRYIVETAGADKTRQHEIIRGFKKKRVNLIYSLTTPGTLIAKEEAADIPLVFSVVTYPMEAGIITSLRNSGCNAVGTRNYIPPARQYYVFERIFSGVKRLAFIHRKGEPNSAIQYREFKAILEPRGIDVIDVAAVDLADLERQLDGVIDAVDAVYSACDTLIQAGGEEIVITVCKKHQKPNFTCNLDGVLKGALVGNVADFYALGRISGEKAVQILQGAEPSWLLTEPPREDHILINQKTAEDLGLNIPEDIRGLASQIIR